MKKFLLIFPHSQNARWGLLGRNIMELEARITTILTLITCLIGIFFAYRVLKLGVQLKQTRKDLEYWKYSSEAKSFLLATAAFQELLPNVHFSINHDTFATLEIYLGGDVKKIQCIQGEDGLIHEVPLK